MSFNSLSGLLGNLQQHPHWEHLRHYQQTLIAWRQVVTPEIYSHTRPIALRQQVLWIATASPVWAQTLSFQRPQLLTQLNRHLSDPLQDLRFSPGQWYQWRPDANPTEPETSPPLTTLFPEESPEQKPVMDPEQALGRWLAVMEQRRQVLPSCPQCQAPTDSLALARWSVCACCARRRWTKTLAQRRD
ncbi:DciA family protein [Synechocystis sp. LKSZ1]|uniref:DUF721 domain-containing protein n=1 Tax=Synechocystis sp. LKSZ1 TaxID=3144951 RepID=UPI00336BFFC2